MQSNRIVQAVGLMLIIVAASSCAATKDYTSRLFKPAQQVKDTQAVALKFLELDQLGGDQEDWVNTDIIKGKDTSEVKGLDILASTIPAQPDSTLLPKTNPVVNTEPVARQVSNGEVRSKKSRD